MNKKSIKLNCDMGESFGIYTLGLDKEIMPYVDMVNLACGFHASDPVTMHKSIKNAKKHDLEIGAHPSYPDLAGFGRRHMICSEEEIVSFIIYQCGALDALCKNYGKKVTYLKPHGALYNTMMKETDVFKAICKAVAKYDKNIKLMILSNKDNDKYKQIADRYDITLLYEVFADRAYEDDGSLVDRSDINALLNRGEVIQRAKLLFEKSIIKTINDNELKLEIDTLCVHGDNKEALELITAIYKLKNDS